MSATSFQNLFLRWLSPFALRIGVPGRAGGRHNLPGNWLQPVPLEEAPIGSLNGLYLEGAAAPRGLRQLTGTLDLLSLGGVAVFLFDGKPWKRGQLQEVCRGGGFHLRAYRPGGIFRKRLLVVLQKQVLAESSVPGKEFSVIIPYAGGPFEETRERVRLWADFLARLDWHERAQIVLVNDALMDNADFHALEGTRHHGLLDLVHHYRSFGPGECVRSGMLHSVGRRVLVDESGGAAPPREMLVLLNEMLREEKIREAAGPTHAAHATCIAGYAAPETAFTTNADRKRRGPRLRRLGLRLRQSLFRLLSGRRAPFSPLRMYSAAMAHKLGRATRERSIYERLEAGTRLRRMGGRVREIPIDLDREEYEEPAPLAMLLHRLRRPLRYLGHALLWLASALAVYGLLGFARGFLDGLLADVPAGLAAPATLALKIGLLIGAGAGIAKAGRRFWFRNDDDPSAALSWIFTLRAWSLLGIFALSEPTAGLTRPLFDFVVWSATVAAVIFGAGVVLWLLLFYRFSFNRSSGL